MMTTLTTPKRGGGKLGRTWKVYKREPEHEGPLVVLPRDIKVFEYLYAHRFLTEAHIVSLLGGGTDGIKKRLRKLYRTGYIDKIGSHPQKAWALGFNGATVLAENGVSISKKINWTSKNNLAGLQVTHTLETSEFMVKCRLGVEEVDGIELLLFPEILKASPGETRKKKYPRKWPIKLQYGQDAHQMNVVPDETIGFHVVEGRPNRNRVLCFAEIDRATIQNKFIDLRTRSNFRKFLAYDQSWQAWRKDPKTAPYGLTDFILLFVTTSRERINSLIESAKEATSGGKILSRFWFAEMSSVETTDNIVEMPWVNGRGKEMRLLDLKP